MGSGFVQDGPYHWPLYEEYDYSFDGTNYGGRGTPLLLARVSIGLSRWATRKWR